ncbi:MAG: hypothetical protein AAFO07_21220, partial [Bacteroidota bacterium]
RSLQSLQNSGIELEVGRRIRVDDTGAEYLVQSDSLAGYPIDDIAVFDLVDKYAVILENQQGGVNPRWFGATGDGVTDDTEAFQNAALFCDVIGNYHFFVDNVRGKNSFLITDTIKIAMPQYADRDETYLIDGNWVEIKKTTPGPIFWSMPDIIGTSGTNTRRIHFKRWLLDGLNSGANGLVFGQSYLSVIEDNEFKRLDTAIIAPFHLHSTVKNNIYSLNNSIDEYFVSGAKYQEDTGYPSNSSGAQTATNHNIIEGNRHFMQDSMFAGSFLWGADQTMIEKNIYEGRVALHGIYLNMGLSVNNLASIKNNWFEHTSSETRKGVSICLDRPRNVLISRNQHSALDTFLQVLDGEDQVITLEKNNVFNAATYVDDQFGEAYFVIDEINEDTLAWQSTARWAGNNPSRFKLTTRKNGTDQKSYEYYNDSYVQRVKGGKQILSNSLEYDVQGNITYNQFPSESNTPEGKGGAASEYLSTWDVNGVQRNTHVEQVVLSEINSIKNILDETTTEKATLLWPNNEKGLQYAYSNISHEVNLDNDQGAYYVRFKVLKNIPSGKYFSIIGTSSNNAFCFLINSDLGISITRNISSNTPSKLTADNVIEVGKWHELILQKNRTLPANQRLRIDLDGNMIYFDGDLSFVTSSRTISIGYSGNVSDASLAAISSVKLFDQGLDDLEVDSVFNKTKTGLYNFDFSVQKDTIFDSVDSTKFFLINPVLPISDYNIGILREAADFTVKNIYGGTNTLEANLDSVKAQIDALRNTNENITIDSVDYDFQVTLTANPNLKEITAFSYIPVGSTANQVLTLPPAIEANKGLTIFVKLIDANATYGIELNPPGVNTFLSGDSLVDSQVINGSVSQTLKLVYDTRNEVWAWTQF